MRGALLAALLVGLLIMPVLGLSLEISIISPENRTFNTTSVYLNWTADAPFSWAAYSLNGGQNISLYRTVEDPDTNTSTGIFASSPETNPDHLYAVDGDWSTDLWSGQVFGFGYIYEGYVIPQEAGGANWTYKVKLESNSVSDVSFWNYTSGSYSTLNELDANVVGSGLHTVSVEVPSEGLSGSDLLIRTEIPCSTCCGTSNCLVFYYEGNATWFGAYNETLTIRKGANSLVMYARNQTHTVDQMVWFTYFLPSLEQTLQVILTINNTVNTVLVPGSGSFPSSGINYDYFTSIPHWYFSSFLGGVLSSVVFNGITPDRVHVDRSEESWCFGADIDRDGSVEISDISELSKNMGRTCSLENGWCAFADVNRDGIVDLTDLSVLTAYYNDSGCGLSGHRLTLSQAFGGSRTLLAFTGGDDRTVSARMPSIEAGTFFEEIFPSFSHGLGLLHPIKILLEYSDIDILGSYILGKGYHTIAFENAGSSGRKTSLEVTAY